MQQQQPDYRQFENIGQELAQSIIKKSENLPNPQQKLPNFEVRKLPQQQKKIDLKNLKQSSLVNYFTQKGARLKQNDQKVEGYQMGDFSMFAKKVQVKLHNQDKLIRAIAKQAVVSYEKKLKQNSEAIKNSLQLEKQHATLKNLFGGNEENIKRFIQDQSEFVTQQLMKQLKQSNPSVNLRTMIRTHIKRKCTLMKTAVVDGKYIEITKLKMKQRFYIDRFIYLPTTSDNLFIKIDQKGKLTKVNFHQGDFFDREGINQLNENIKKQIIGMILLYLKQKQILIQKDKVYEIGQIVANVMKQITQKKDENG